ncbi:CHAT domain-containing protein [Merismopedia glauca]|nr:CHAT domain-containing protein [Merismopedia glauca]
MALSQEVEPQTDVKTIYQLLQNGRDLEARQLIEKLPDSAPALALWGQYYLTKGELDSAIAYFEKSLTQSNSTSTKVDLGYALWRKYLANLKLIKRLEGILIPAQLAQLPAEKLKTSALENWQSALQSSSTSSLDRAKASIYLATADPQYLKLAEQSVTALVDNETKVPFLLKLFSLSKDKKWLELALKLPSDRRTKSYIYYKLGRLEKAILIAEAIPAPDLQWRYLWGMAKTFPEGNLHRENYVSLAVSAVESFRPQSAIFNEARLEIEEEVQPVYQELARISLAKNQIDRGLEVMKSLKITQLQDFFQDDCFEFVEVAKSTEPGTVRIQTLATEKETYLVLEGDNLKKAVRVPINRSELVQLAREFRGKLQNIATDDYVIPSAKLYNLLIRPILPDLKGVKSLVFVSDFPLNLFPYAALYDGDKFLVEDYAISYSAGLEVENAKNPPGSATLLASISEPPQPWDRLPYASAEVETVSGLLKGTPQKNLKFADFKRQLQSESVGTVHLASHIQIAGNIARSQVVFADGAVSLSQLEQVLSDRTNVLDLLVLSGCDTGIGDSRSVLGLAGIAIKNNVNQVLASLWAVNDGDTAKLMEAFYQYRLQGMSEDLALQNAQISLIKSQSGDFTASGWSSFILVKK